MMMMMMSVESMPRLAVIAVVFCAVAIGAAPYQELVPRAGHVPVYIRVGNTPLSEIHPRLAEAFNEIESGSLLLEDSKPDFAKLQNTESLEAVATTQEENNKDSEKTRNDDDDGEEVPAIVVEQVKNAAESDIASFDVVKGGSSEVEAVGQELAATSDKNA